ncbi:hypothetical protein [Falsibacillus pallidus]|uniref:hypothetical protein n=1 Tax=Falsibacillus pallidus TaxID=493781 RepID=UPI003D950EFC
MFVQLLMWSLLILPWFLLLFFHSNKLKRFFPAGIFSSLILTFIFQIADKFDWWIVQKNIPLLANITTNAYGLFLVGTIIIIYFTYGNFFKYMIVNLVVDVFLSFIAGKWFEHLGIYRLENINHFGVLLLTLGIAVIIYLYQIWQDKIMKEI